MFYDERRVESKQTEIEGNQVVYIHLHFAVMQGVEILFCYWIVAQINAFLVVSRVQLLLRIYSAQILRVDVVNFERLAIFVIDHEVKSCNLVGNRVA